MGIDGKGRENTVVDKHVPGKCWGSNHLSVVSTEGPAHFALILGLQLSANQSSLL